MLRERWSHLERMDAVPEQSARSFLAHLQQSASKLSLRLIFTANCRLCEEVTITRGRLLRRAEAMQQAQTRVRDFMWRIQRGSPSAVAHLNLRSLLVTQLACLELKSSCTMLRTCPMPIINGFASLLVCILC